MIFISSQEFNLWTKGKTSIITQHFSGFNETHFEIKDFLFFFPTKVNSNSILFLTSKEDYKILQAHEFLIDVTALRDLFKKILKC